MIKKKKKILILFSSGSLGGTEISITRMAMHNSNLFEYQLATMGGKGDWSNFCFNNKVKPKIFGLPNSNLKLLGFQLKSILNLFKDINSSHYSIIYVFGFRASVLIRILKVFTKKFKLVIGIRWNPNSKKSLDKVFRIFESFFFRTVNHYICNSIAAQNTMLKIKPQIRKRVSTIYNGVKIPDNNSIFECSEIKYIIFPANIYKSKGHIKFIDIIDAVTKEFPNVKFLIAGKDKMKGNLNAEIKSKRVDQFVEILGFQNNLDELMKKSKFMVLPSFSEGCPTSILEAFANKIPVIAYSIDGIPELIKDCYDGFLISPFDKKQFTSKIVYLLKNPNTTSAMGKRGESKVKKFFTITKCAINHEDLFEKILNKQ